LLCKITSHVEIVDGWSLQWPAWFTIWHCLVHRSAACKFPHWMSGVGNGRTNHKLYHHASPPPTGIFLTFACDHIALQDQHSRLTKPMIYYKRLRHQWKKFEFNTNS
jgi:hypothetical protein